MKKLFYSAAIAALALTACAKVETIDNTSGTPVGFSAYSGKSVTKAGAPGELTTTGLQTTGFGVFAYQTTGNYVASGEGAIEPNFMYNTQVSTASWTYSPIKYWPNTLAGTSGTGGKTDGQSGPDALGYHIDKVSFFAYAPFQRVKATTGVPSSDGSTEYLPGDAEMQYGITALTSNAVEGDPKVTYKVSNDLDKQVDLLWAVYNSAAGPWNNVAGTTNTPDDGKPYLNLQKPATNTAIHFYFRHALAQLRVRALAAYNQTLAGGTRQGGVKITIESVELTVPGQYQTAVLNLNNTTTTANTPLWESPQAGSSDLVLNIAGGNINSKMKDTGAKSCATMGESVPGVIYEASSDNVYDADVDVITQGKYFTLIPKTGSTTVNVKVTYYVTTDDANLKDGYSRVKNVISRDVVFTGGFAGGTRNTIMMILGISEVKFDAIVSDWETGESEDVYLPKNLGV